MKHLKKLLVVVAALAMAMAMTATAFAADTHTISVKDTDTHTYDVYQVLTGTVSEPGSAQLGNPAWGSAVTPTEGKVDGKTAQQFIDSIKDLRGQALAEAVHGVLADNAETVGQVKKGSPLTGLETGYYILVDVTTPLDHDGKIDTKAMHVIQVLNDVEGIDIKWGTTEDQKKIASDTLGNNGENTVNGSTDDVSIGDTVNFQITATVPANANLYNYFYFVVNDTLDPGLTLNANSIAVYKDSVSNENLLVANEDYALKTGDAAFPKSFQVGMIDAKSLAGKDIIVTYSAVLNENATIGEVPNKNTSTVTFSNDPNHEYDGTPDTPGFPDEEDLKVTGETPASVTQTYTTAIEIQKVDENGDVLTGAEFTIRGNSAEIVLVSTEQFTEAADGKYYGLKDGTFTEQAPVEKDYMKEAEEGATKGYVVDASATGEDVVTIDDVKYRPYKDGDTGPVYVLVKANADKYDGNQYDKTVTYTQKDSKSGSVDVTAAVGPDGVVTFRGLGAGTYTITETKTPAGYNTIAPFDVAIAFTADPAAGEVHWTTTSESAAYNAETGTFNIQVENQKGTELPSTGGMGTTILYVVGGIMVLLAVVFLITKKRVASKKNDSKMI